MQILVISNDVLSEDLFYAGLDSNHRKITTRSDGCLHAGP